MDYRLIYTREGATVVSSGRFGIWGEYEEEEELSSPLPPGCKHEWVNVSLNQIKMACKHCGVDKLSRD